MRHDILSNNYPIRLRFSTIFVVVGLALLTYIFPRFIDENMPLTQDDKQDIIELTDIPVTEQKKIIIPPSRPRIPVIDPAVEFEDDDFTIEEIPFEKFTKWRQLPPADDKNIDVKFVPFDKAPEPVGGYAALGRNVIYPEFPREAGIHGTVIIQTYIDENGNVKETIVLSSGMLNTGLDVAAIKAIRKTKWKPAQQRDKNVAVWVSIPIKFSLE